jgi:hypothetical protein
MRESGRWDRLLDPSGSYYYSGLLQVAQECDGRPSIGRKIVLSVECLVPRDWCEEQVGTKHVLLVKGVSSMILGEVNQHCSLNWMPNRVCVNCLGARM